MLASHKWLMELSGLDLTPTEVQTKLTSAGLEVESARAFGTGLDRIVVAEVRGSRRHPERDKLRLVTVFDGKAEQEVVCGAPNVPEEGHKVVLAQLGARLPGGLEIAERKLGGIVSKGMLCSETELEIGSDESGIVVLGPDHGAAAGSPVAEALHLGDVAYEIGLTPNRPDCLGHVGIARELCVLMGQPFELPSIRPAERTADADTVLFPQANETFFLSRQWSGQVTSEVFKIADFNPVRVDIRAPDRCLRYGAALVGDVQIGPSPFDLRYRLHVLGQRSINNVVDATNLIMLGFGHPIHAFDYDKLRESRIEVRLAQAGERLTTLDGVERELAGDDLLICDGGGPVALAGVMGGEDSEISESTSRVLIECAYFDPRSVRRTSKRTGLHTDSSHRFERGVDPRGVRGVLTHAATLIAELATGVLVEAGLDVHPRPTEPAHIPLRFARVEALLGMPFERAAAERLFTALGCEISSKDEGLHVVAPTFRPDLTREEDLIEELARLSSYDRIPTLVPNVRPSPEGSPAALGFLRRAREAAAAAGLDEAINYAFLSPEQLRLTRVSRDAVRMANPLSEERSVLRTSLLPGLLDNVRTAQRHQQKRCALFEVSRVFAPAEAGGLPHEHFELGIVMWGARSDWFSDEAKVDFYDVKGAVESVARPLVGCLPTTVLDPTLETEAPYLHPKRSARVMVGERSVGVIGEIHPNVVEDLKLEGRPVYAAVALSVLQTVAESLGIPQATTPPRFPSATRDIAVVVDEGTAASEVAAILQQAAGGLAEGVTLFDIYRGKPVPDAHKSLAFHVVYRDPEATLTDKQVDKAHAKVVRAAEQRFGASVRR